MKLGEVVVHMHITTSPSFIKIAIEIKKVLLIAHFLFSLFTYFFIHLILLINFYMNWPLPLAKSNFLSLAMNWKRCWNIVDRKIRLGPRPLDIRESFSFKPDSRFQLLLTQRSKKVPAKLLSTFVNNFSLLESLFGAPLANWFFDLESRKVRPRPCRLCRWG